MLIRDNRIPESWVLHKTNQLSKYMIERFHQKMSADGAPSVIPPLTIPTTLIIEAEHLIDGLVSAAGNKCDYLFTGRC